jgi:hypothetical protein
MEITKKLSNSTRKFVRTQKEKIRRTFWDTKKQNEEIAELYKKLIQTAVAAVVLKVAKAPVVKAAAKKVKK